MLKSIAATSTALSLLSFLAFPANAVPLLSGSYLWTSSTFCQPTQTAKGENLSADMTSAVASVGLNNHANNLQTGTATFVQGATPESGNLTVAVTNDEGSPFLESGAIGSSNNTVPLNQFVGGRTVPFTQTAKTVSINGSTLNLYYGKSAGGIAQSAAYGGIDSKGCAEQGMLIHS